MEAKHAAAISALQEVISSCDQVLEDLRGSPPGGQSTPVELPQASELPNCEVTAKMAATNLLQFDMDAEALLLRNEGNTLYRKLRNFKKCNIAKGMSKIERSVIVDTIGPFPELPQDPEEAVRFCNILKFNVEKLASQLRRHAKRLIVVLKDVHHAHGTGGGKGKKRSTVKGEAQAKIIAGLTEHHKFNADETARQWDCGNVEPIKLRAFADKIGVSNSRVSDFLGKKFGGYQGYRVACRDPVRIGNAIAAMNGELIPNELYSQFKQDIKDGSL